MIDKIIHYKLSINIWTLIIYFIISLSLVLIPSIISIRIISNRRIEATNHATYEENRLLQNQLDSYKQEISEIVRIRDTYRSSIREIVEMLHARDSHIAAGGQLGTGIELSDEINILTIRNIIASMDDDQRLLREVRHYLSARRSFIESFPFIWPVQTRGVPHISSGYGFRGDVINPLTENVHYHRGIDIDLPVGTPVIATATGFVESAYFHHQLGNIIILNHENGFTTVYSHLNEFNVRRGERVVRGQQIGTVGNTGLSTGPHLHYEIRQNGISMDPMMFLTTNF